jgi:predicted nucleic acid-binding protein
MIVLDASAALPLLLDVQPIATAVNTRLAKREETIHVPHVFDLELIQALRLGLLQGVVGSARANQAIIDLVDMRLVRYPHVAMSDRVWELRDNLSAYDAVYVALAETLDAPLITCDARLARSPAHEAHVELLE